MKESIVKFATFLAACAIALGPASAIEKGDVLTFSDGRCLRQVTVEQRLSATAFTGTLDGYAGSLNAAIVATEAGWTLNVNDWKAGCSWRVVSESGLQTVDRLVKPRHAKHVCWTHGRRAVEEPAYASLRKVVGGGWTQGWEEDPVANEVDILVVYEKKAVAWLSKTGRTTQAHAEAQIAKMNLALANSGLADDFRVSLCGVFEADIDVTRDCGRDPDDYLGVALRRAVESSGAKWAAIRAARERVGADIVMILADSDPQADSVEDVVGTVGISAVLENDSAKGRFGLVKSILDDQREQAYGVCNVRIVEADNTFSHEVAHVMGAGHSELLSPDFSVPGPQLFTYSTAKMYQDCDGGYYYTIMGYDSTDGLESSPAYQEIPYFSSPELYHPETGTVLGDAKHDNVRTLRETYAIISQFRVNASRRTTPAEPSDVWNKARVVTGALAEDGTPIGVVELKIGRINARSKVVRVSGTLRDLNGKKSTLKADVQPVVTGDAIVVSMSLRGREDRLVATVSAEDLVAMSLGSASLLPDAVVGGKLAKDSSAFILSDESVTVLATAIDGLQVELLPREERFSVTSAGKWSFARAASVKWLRDRKSGEYALSVDTSRGRTNLSGLKLAYTTKTGVFKGTFSLYTLNGVKMKKVVANVAGTVVNGMAYGTITVRKPAISLPVTIE